MTYLEIESTNVLLCVLAVASILVLAWYSAKGYKFKYQYIMKKIVYIIAAVLSISLVSQAQAQVVTPSEVITLTANLNTTLSLSMDKSDVTFDFTTLEDFKEGLGGYENEKYLSTSNVSSTANWKLSFNLESEMTHKDGDANMPLENVRTEC